MPSVCVVYHSGFGHTKVQAEHVAKGAEAVEGTEVHLLPAEDFKAPVDHQYGPEWDVLMQADAIVFGCPTYMGSASAVLKQFMEHSSGAWFGAAWKDKIAAGFTNSASWSGDKLNTLQGIFIFAMQHQMVWVGLDLMPGNNSSTGTPEDLNRVGCFSGAMAQSNADEGPDVAPPEADRKTAEHLGRRVAEAAARWGAA
ncbi:MAG: flavodoxin family protein [Planctomycetota bacterium]|nr:flavodoxin family protein [Planctomycetota bacterium]